MEVNQSERIESNGDMLSESEIQEEFQKLQQIVFDYEETLNDNGFKYEQTIQKFLNLQQSIIHHGLFSPNEEIEEILVENIKYFLIPYYIGQVLGRISQNRRATVSNSKIYLNQFLQLTEYYQILTKEQKSIWKNLQEDSKYQISRQDKIASYQQKQILEAQLNNIEKIDDEKSQREIYLTQLQICIFKAIDSLKLIRDQLEILDYQEKIEKDQEAQQQHLQKMSQPLPQLKYIQIPKMQGTLPYMLKKEGVKQGEITSVMNGTGQHGEGEGHLCHSCYGKSMIEMREQYKEQVWQPGISMPTMRLDDFADQQIERMRITEESNQRAAEQAQLQEEIDSDLDEQEDDKKQKKARDWDDWKDAHEKGAGNKLR